jgi:hypothetical protein
MLRWVSEARADLGVIGTLKDRPKAQIVSMSRGEADAIKRAGRVDVTGYLLGDASRACILEQSSVEV